ncbi:MAG: transglutaminase domain-containing protein [Ruminococcus sp.]|nr:transglutaminase domain-containing protein [Ruminococcus sp.]
MSKKLQGNSNGVAICDSIVMSVRNKRPNIRKPLAVFISIAGYFSVIFSFLGMFDLVYDEVKFGVTCILLSAVYITLSLIGRKALWLILGSIVAFGISAYRRFEELTKGFEYVYNVVYSTSFHTNISYYKYLKPRLEEEYVTTLLIFAVWLLAIIIYFFTIYKPNPIFPLLISFPILEVGLYNGIEIPLFWGVMTVAYWLALMAMSTIDVGEYIGGVGGFVRRGSLFFPKKQMKLKVTEQCGLVVMACVLIISGVSLAVMRATDYERSDEINQKRRDISEAFSNFSFDNFFESVSGLSKAFGIDLSFDNHKLGTQDHVRYKNTTDLICTFDRKYDGAVYLKSYTGAVYGDNQWNDLDSSAYSDGIFGDFDEYGVYAQDFPCIMSKYISSPNNEMTVWIISKLKEEKTFAPYGTDSMGELTYYRDSTVSSKSGSADEYSYNFMPVSAAYVAPFLDESNRLTFSLDSINDKNWYSEIEDYCDKNDLFTYSGLFSVDTTVQSYTSSMYSDGKAIMALLLESRYREFVYDNYLQVPDNNNMDEVREAYSDILSKADTANSAAEKINLLQEIRERIAQQTDYSLDPGKTPGNRDFVNYFLLENKKGYCTHFASSGVLLARMAGIPARYATGYIIVGDDFSSSSKNKDGSYTINVKDNRSHAWAEVYLDGYGWVPFEFTAGYSNQSIDTNKPKQTTSAVTTNSSTVTTTAAASGTTLATSSGGREATTRENQVTTRSDVTTTLPATSAAGIRSGSSSGSIRVPDFVKKILFSVMLISAAVCIILLRRCLTLKLREKRFTTGSNARRIAHMYAYAVKLLGSVGIKQSGIGYIEFAKQVEERCCGKNGRRFPEGAFNTFMDTALRSSFGQRSAGNADAESCRKFVDTLSANIYEESGWLRRLSLRYLSVLSR